jgi:DNA replication and repair protein RecF
VHLTKLRLYQYRNIPELEINPGQGTTLFVGRNGQGKTNILEAIYFLAFGRSFRTSTAGECIRHGEKECRIEATVRHGTLTKDLEVRISRHEKKMFLFGKQESLDAFVGNFHILAFTCDHLNIVRKSPADRRAFLDRAMAAIYPGHVRALILYGRSLKQRNRILSSPRAGETVEDDRVLDSWDEMIVQQGTQILSNRIRYVEQMKQCLPRGLFGSEELKMHYYSSVADKRDEGGGIGNIFRQKLQSAREHDRRMGYTSVGPHRDDLKLYVNGKALGDFGSAGQQRSSLLSMYFAQMEIHRQLHGFYPVFLVDDAEAELDEQRLQIFLGYLTEKTQTFLTSAKQFLLPDAGGEICSLEVRNGTVRTI